MDDLGLLVGLGQQEVLTLVSSSSLRNIRRPALNSVVGRSFGDSLLLRLMWATVVTWE